MDFLKKDYGGPREIAVLLHIPHPEVFPFDEGAFQPLSRRTSCWIFSSASITLSRCPLLLDCCMVFIVLGLH